LRLRLEARPGLVGESGSGKTTLGRAVLRLERITAGRVVFDGADVTTFDRRRLKHFRRQRRWCFRIHLAR
jgi:ABC-type oligopeptide transport system ATPase subunit